MLRSPLGFAQIALSVGNPTTGVYPAPNAPRGPDYTGRDTSETVFPSHVFLAEDVSSAVRCFRDGSFIPCPARHDPGVDVSTPEAARGAAHERASCELHDPMACCRQFFPTRYKVVAHGAPSAAIRARRRVVSAEFKKVVPLESRIVEANAGSPTSNTSFYHLDEPSIVVLIDVSAANCSWRLPRAPAASAAIVNQS
jgi:hypothetical protein